ncbi:MAG: pilus assembly protein [Planctomycetales bacterium]|nr:pilus assembly protein [Planctomycetales bacterium]MBN8629021.1 pilus assembly protein [Planctomycetota bacterium]
MKPLVSQRPTKIKSDRRGAAAVEFAICLPILTVLVLAVIEASNAVYVQQAITSAAYEASNVVSASGGTATDAQTRANSVLTSLGIKSASVSITPAVTSSTPLGTQISVTCSAPLSANLTSFGYLGAPTLRSTIITVKL